MILVMNADWRVTLFIEPAERISSAEYHATPERPQLNSKNTRCLIRRIQAADSKITD